MSGVYSRVVTTQVLLVVASVLSTTGNILPVNGTLLSISVSTWFTAAPAAGTTVEIFIGNAGAPTKPLYTEYEVQGGASWLVATIPYNGLWSAGIDINQDTYVWFRSSSANAHVAATLVVADP